MSVLVLSLPGMERLSARLAAALGVPMGTLVGASVPRWRMPGADRSGRQRQSRGDRSRLDRPDDKLLPVVFGAATARDLGADSVGLVAPYLAYMRQDRRFHAGTNVALLGAARYALYEATEIAR